MIILIRHGEAEHNKQQIFDSSINSRSHLTDFGIMQIQETSNKIKDFLFNNHSNISRIFCSPLLRTIESAKIFKEIIQANNLYNDDRFCIDYRIREAEMGIYDKKYMSEYPNTDGRWSLINNEKYNGENTEDIIHRVNSFIDHLNRFNVNVVITHGEIFKQIVYLLSEVNVDPTLGQSMIIDMNKIIYDTQN